MIFFVTFLIIFIGSVNAANVYHVNTTGSDTNTGSQSNPFASINKSVTVTNAGNGDDEIIIASGTYKGSTNRQITITQNVSIYSAKYKNLESDETYIDVEGYNKNIFVILGPNIQVNFYGINFINSNSPANANAAIYSANASLTISDCTFNKANIYVVNSTNVKLYNNNFYNYTVTPITFSNLSDSEISNNTFNTITNIVTIFVTTASNLTFFNNTFNYNFTSTPNILSLSSVTGVIIKNNRFLISSRAGSAILSAGSSSNFTILGNEFSNVNNAINLPNINGTIIEGNIITNVTTGILVTNSNGTVRIFNNSIENATTTVISLTNMNGGVFIGNNTIIMGNRSATGISVGITTGNINKNVNVVNNTITNATTAIALTAVNGSAIENNTIVDSGTGISVTNTALNTASYGSPIRIFNNTIEVNVSAITLVQCNVTSVDILSNTIYGSDNAVTYGLSVTNANITRLSGNYFNNTRFFWSGSATNLNRVYEIVDNEFLNVNGQVVNSNALVENLVILNNIFNVTGSTNQATLTFSSVSGADIRNNSFYRTYNNNTSILISNGNYSSLNVVNNTFNNFVTGFSMTNFTNVVVENNSFVDTNTSISLNNVTDVTIYNNTITGGSSAYKVSVNGSKVNFTNNKIFDANGGGVFIRADDTLFENNIIDSLIPTATAHYAVNINGNNLIVRNNLLNNSGSPTLNSNGMNINGSDVTVTNNIVDNCKRYNGIIVNSSGGIVMNNYVINFFTNASTLNAFSLIGKDILFEYNQVYNVTLENNPFFRGLSLNGENLTVRHNLFDSCQEGILGTAHYSLIFNNTINNMSSNGMRITYSIGTIIDFNIVNESNGIGIAVVNGGNYTISI